MKDALLRHMLPRVGLCSVCRHVRTVENRRGSAFFLCGRARTDPSFPRYPRLPVLACRGFEAVDIPDDQADGRTTPTGDDG